MAASCLANMNWKMWDGVSPTLSRPWNFCRHSMSMEIFESSPSHVSTKYLLKVISCGSGTHFHQSHPPLMDINWMEMK